METDEGRDYGIFQYKYFRRRVSVNFSATWPRFKNRVARKVLPDLSGASL